MHDKSMLILFNLDINNICASGGSACTSGASVSSHVISAINPNADIDFVTVRFSFSRHNTKEDQAQTRPSHQPLDDVPGGEWTTLPQPGGLEKAMDPSPDSAPSTPAAELRRSPYTETGQR